MVKGAPGAIVIDQKPNCKISRGVRELAQLGAVNGHFIWLVLGIEAIHGGYEYVHRLTLRKPGVPPGDDNITL